MVSVVSARKRRGGGAGECMGFMRVKREGTSYPGCVPHASPAGSNQKGEE